MTVVTWERPTNGKEDYKPVTFALILAGRSAIFSVYLSPLGSLWLAPSLMAAR